MSMLYSGHSVAYTSFQRSETPSLTFSSDRNNNNNNNNKNNNSKLNDSNTSDTLWSDTAPTEAELEEDAQLQLDAFIRDQELHPTSDQWRWRVVVNALLHDSSGAWARETVPSADSHIDDTSSFTSECSSSLSVRLFFGAQQDAIPEGWKQSNTMMTRTSTPKLSPSRLPSSRVDNIIPKSPNCSAVRLSTSTDIDGSDSSHSDDPSLHFTSSVDVDPSNFASSKKLSEVHHSHSDDTYHSDLNESSSAALEAATRSLSPVSLPSPSPPAGRSSQPSAVLRLPRPRSHVELSFTTEASSPLSPVVSTLVSYSIVRPASLVTSKDVPRRYETPYVFPMSARNTSASNSTILKLANLPWSSTCEDVLRWLGEDIEKTMMPAYDQIASVHILCDRFKCRTKCPAYIELINLTAAQTVIETRNFTELAGRKVKITLATKRELMCAIFPTWAQSHFSHAFGVPIVSNFELEGLVELCKLKMPFAKAIPERPYMNILSIASKYPWKSQDLLSPQNEEQAKVLQAVRDGYKLLNQHGKRISAYESIKTLYLQFLTKHGGKNGRYFLVEPEVEYAAASTGTAGSLRPIPVSASRSGSSQKSSMFDPPTDVNDVQATRHRTKRKIAVEGYLPLISFLQSGESNSLSSFSSSENSSSISNPHRTASSEILHGAVPFSGQSDEEVHPRSETAQQDVRLNTAPLYATPAKRLYDAQVSAREDLTSIHMTAPLSQKEADRVADGHELEEIESLHVKNSKVVKTISPLKGRHKLSYAAAASAAGKGIDSKDGVGEGHEKTDTIIAGNAHQQAPDKAQSATAEAVSPSAVQSISAANLGSRADSDVITIQKTGRNNALNLDAIAAELEMSPGSLKALVKRLAELL